MKNILLISLCFLISAYSQAATLKLATLVPKGTNWAKTLKKMSKEVKEKTEGKVKIKIYYGGVSGDEPDVLRKIRVGQLHGGIFTGKVMGEIYPDSRVLELPFNFYNDEEKALKAVQSLGPEITSGFDKKGFINLGLYGIGNVYVVSKKEAKSISDLKGIKIWAWEGDELVGAMVSSLGLVSVPLALPDVLSSLSTGMIDAAYAPPLGILALQWQSKIKYLINFPTAYSIGSLLIAKKRWKKISAPHQVIVKGIVAKYIKEANEFAIKDNKKSLEALKSMGVKFLEFANEDKSRADKIRADIITKLKGKMLSPAMLKKVESLR